MRSKHKYIAKGKYNLIFCLKKKKRQKKGGKENKNASFVS